MGVSPADFKHYHRPPATGAPRHLAAFHNDLRGLPGPECAAICRDMPLKIRTRFGQRPRSHSRESLTMEVR
jgi:hypothetical protein